MKKKIPISDWIFFAGVILIFIAAVFGIANICRGDDSYNVYSGSDPGVVDYISKPSGTSFGGYTVTDGSLNPVYKVEGDKIMDYGTRQVVGVIKDDKIYSSDYRLDYTNRGGQVKDMNEVVQWTIKDRKAKP